MHYIIPHYTVLQFISNKLQDTPLHYIVSIERYYTFIAIYCLNCLQHGFVQGEGGFGGLVSHGDHEGLSK